MFLQTGLEEQFSHAEHTAFKAYLALFDYARRRGATVCYEGAMTLKISPLLLTYPVFPLG